MVRCQEGVMKIEFDSLVLGTNYTLREGCELLIVAMADCLRDITNFRGRVCCKGGDTKLTKAQSTTEDKTQESFVIDRLANKKMAYSGRDRKDR